MNMTIQQTKLTKNVNYIKILRKVIILYAVFYSYIKSSNILNPFKHFANDGSI